MMPVAWVKTYTGTAGKTARVFTTTMGAAHDLESEGVRRMLVNAALLGRRPRGQDPRREPTSPSSASTTRTRSGTTGSRRA